MNGRRNFAGKMTGALKFAITSRTKGVSHGGDGASVQVLAVCEIGQNHGQVRAPVAPLLLSTALKKECRNSSLGRANRQQPDGLKANIEAVHTVADAGILPDISWYTV